MAIVRVRHTYKLYMNTMRGKHLAIGQSEAYIQAVHAHNERKKLGHWRVWHIYMLYMHTMGGKHLAIGRVRYTYKLYIAHNERKTPLGE